MQQELAVLLCLAKRGTDLSQEGVSCSGALWGDGCL